MLNVEGDVSDESEISESDFDDDDHEDGSGEIVHVMCITLSQ